MTKYTRDGKGRITAIQDAHGSYRYLEYDPMDRIIADTDENGVRRTYDYDARGNLVRWIDGLGNSEYYSYDGNDRLTRLVDRNGETYIYTYDALNRIVSETNPLDGTKTFHYDKDSRIVGVTDRNGVRTSYKLDGNGNIVESVDGEGHSSFFEYDSMNRLTKVTLRRIDKIHKVDEIQETLYTYDHRGLVKTEINAAGDGKALIYDGNGNLIQKTDEDGYVTEYEYSPVNLVSKASYADGKTATYLYDGTGDLIRMVDWVGETTFEYDLLDRLLNVNDHNDRNVNYVYDNVGNTIAIQYPDGTQADYWYDAENQMVELADLDGGLSRFEFDPNGNVIYKEYPNNETALYSYDAWNQLIELDEYDLGGKKHFKTTYTWDAEGNRLTEMQYNHGQTGKPAALSSDTPDTSGSSGTREMVDALISAALPNQADLFSLFANNDDPAEGVFALPGMDALSSGNSSTTTPGNGGANTGKDDATIPGNGDGNGQVPPGQTEDEEGGIKNPAGHYPPGLNRGKKPDKPENPDKPDKPENPGTEDKSDRKAQKGEHIYEYNKNGWVIQGTVAKETTTYTYDTLGNLVQEKCKNTTIDYRYNILNQLVSRTDKNDSVTFSYDKRGNRVAEVGKKATEAYVYDATNHLVEGTNWKGDKSAYTYNGLFVRVQNTQTTHAGQVYDREFVIDYNSFERNDLMVFSPNYYEQKHIYTAWGERMEQFTERGNWDRLLYVHEDIMGNTRYYTKDNGQSFAELEYDVWGAITSPSKLNNNDNGNFAAAIFTGHPYDTVLDIYFAEARFYDANHRQWMSVDPIKSGLNWYQYANGNPATFFDPTGLWYITIKENYIDSGDVGSSTKYILTVREEYNLFVGLKAAEDALLHGIITPLVSIVREHFEGAYIGNTHSKTTLRTLVDLLPSNITDEAFQKIAEEISGKTAEEIGKIIGKEIGKEFGEKVAKDVLKWFSVYKEVTNALKETMHDDHILDVMNDAEFPRRTVFETREDAEKEADVFYQMYFETKKYMEDERNFFYFKPLQCLPTFFEVAQKAIEYGAGSRKFHNYIEKQVKIFEKNIKRQMDNIKGSIYAYNVYGTFDADKLMAIAKEMTLQYELQLYNAKNLYDYHIKKIQQIAEKFVK